MSIYQIFLANFKIFYRNRSAFFWSIGMPSIIYIAVSVLPINRVAGDLGVKYSTFLLPGLLAMSIMQGGIYGLAYRMVDFKARGVLKRFTVTPVTRFQFIAGSALAMLLLMIFQSIAIGLIGIIFFKVPLTHNPLHLLSSLTFILLGGLVFLLFGLIISIFADTYEAAAPITAGIGLPLTFLSDIFYPLSILPQALQNVAHVLPMTYFSSGLRNSLLVGDSLSGLSTNILILCIWLVVLCSFIAWKFRLEN